jgi:hypothetical protein
MARMVNSRRVGSGNDSYEIQPDRLPDESAWFCCCFSRYTAQKIVVVLTHSQGHNAGFW